MLRIDKDDCDSKLITLIGGTLDEGKNKKLKKKKT